MTDISWLDWPSPSNVKACSTLREAGVSRPPFDTFNVAAHVGDEEGSVIHNRKILGDAIGPVNIHWLEQVHSTNVVNVMDDYNSEADASFSRQPKQACCVMTADCLPVFLCDKQGSQVAIAHAGWRGLCNGIIQNTLSTFHSSQSVIAYLGPAISQAAFEVGNEVREAFTAQYKFLHLEEHFIRGEESGKWMADLYGIARAILNDRGVNQVYGGDCCTFLESGHYFSYRRDGQTGRMAHLIWME